MSAGRPEKARGKRPEAGVPIPDTEAHNSRFTDINPEAITSVP